MKDSRGKQSTTLMFVSIAFAVTTIKFAASGIHIDGMLEVAEFGGGEYAAAIGAILGIWLGREYTEKTKVKDNAQ